MEWLWASLAIAFLVVELNTRRLVAVWVSVGASMSMMVKLIFPELRFVWQGVIFLALSAVLILITYPITRTIFNKNKKDDNE